MGRLIADISTSVDGFVAGSNDGLELGLGEGGERLHQWLYDLSSWRERHGLEGGEPSQDARVLEEAVEGVGAYVMGRRMFDIAVDRWGEDPPFHGPVFVVTHRAREPLPREGGTTFTFVTEGVERAVEQAKVAAGHQDVSVAGGANTIQQCLAAGLLDEIQIHVVPVLLGRGRRLFDDMPSEQIVLERIRVIDSPAVTHLKYRVAR